MFMSTNLRSSRRMSVAEFIEMIRPFPDEERWELLDGEPVLTAPQDERHQTIVANLLGIVDRPSRGCGGRALPGLGLLNDAIDDYAPIPDVVVRCGPIVVGGFARDPVLVAEVLSPSTMNNDRGRKIDFYRSLHSLRTILLVYADELRVEAWQRDEAGEWGRSVLTDPATSLPLPELEAALPLRAIYEDVPLA